MDPLSGSLLVASSAIDDGPFRRSVVYLLDSDEDGALGVILNRPLPSGVDIVLPDWAESVDAPGHLFNGGPVEMDSALAVGVAKVGAHPSGWRPMAGRIGLVDLDGPVPGPGEFDGLRVYAGYAGWSSGQLEAEIAEGAWLVLPARETDMRHSDPGTLWREVLRRQPGETRFWASLPDEPSDN